MKYGETRCQNEEKRTIEIYQFAGTDRNILIFHTTKGGGKLIFGIDIAKWCMFTNM